MDTFEEVRTVMLLAGAKATAELMREATARVLHIFVNYCNAKECDIYVELEVDFGRFSCWNMEQGIRAKIKNKTNDVSFENVI